MSRLAVFSLFMALAVQGQSQMFSHGVPAGAMSPEPDGRQHGIPASVVSPTPIPFGVHPQFFFNPNGPRRHFGPRLHHQTFVPVPIFIPAYGYGYDAAYPVADPSVPTPSDSAQAANEAQDQAAAAPAARQDDLRQAYLQGARDALAHERDDLRYGDHYMDSREEQRSADSANNDRPAPRTRREEPAAELPPAKPDNTPATVFIFKDGHQIETHNFAIMGETLYDFSGSILKKVQLADLDKDATLKANDDRGIIVKLP